MNNTTTKWTFVGFLTLTTGIVAAWICLHIFAPGFFEGTVNENGTLAEPTGEMNFAFLFITAICTAITITKGVTIFKHKG